MKFAFNFIFTKLSTRTCLILCCIIILKPPINQYWSAIVLCLSTFLIIFSELKNLKRIWLTAIGITVFMFLFQSIIPRIQIEEGHHFFTLSGNQDVYKDNLPENVYWEASQMFIAAYPKESWCDENVYGCWRHFDGPSRPFAFSPDAFFSSPRYSRIVETIDFKDYRSFNAGFTNNQDGKDGCLNWYADYGPLSRFNVPFYVMYEIPQSLIGSEICGSGPIFWPTSSEEMRYTNLESITCLPIGSDLVGKKLIGLSIGNNKLQLKLKPIFLYKFIGVSKIIISIGALFFLLISSLKINLPFNIRPFPLQTKHLILFSLSILQTFCYKFWEFKWPIFWGGGDGLTHYSFARNILEFIQNLDFANALQGIESVFYFVPGLRYFRAIELAIFGNTAFGYWIIVLFFASVFFTLLRLFFNEQTAFKLSIFFALPLSPWHLHRILGLARKGLAEPLGILLFFIGLVIILRSINFSQRLKGTFLGWICIASSVILRPDLSVAIAVFCCLVGIYFLKNKKISELIIPIFGMLPSFFMLVHNIYFGGKWILLTSSGTISDTYRCPPETYLRAFVELFQGRTSPELDRVLHQLGEWAGFPPILPIFFFIHVLIIFKIKTAPWIFKTFAITGLGLHFVLFFWRASDRYVLLAWYVTFIVTAYGIQYFMKTNFYLTIMRRK